MMKSYVHMISIYIVFAGFLILSKIGHSSNYESLVQNEKLHSEVLTKLVTKFSQYEQVDFKVKKTSLQALLGRTKESEGEMSLTGEGKFWWKIITPQETTLVFDGQFAWNEERLSQDLGGGIKVAKSAHFKASPAYKVLQVLMGKGELTELFSPLKTSREGSVIELQLTPQKKEWNVSLLKIKIDEDKLSLLEISYLDDLENKTTLEFSKPAFNKKQKVEKFKYVPPKGADITEI